MAEAEADARQVEGLKHDAAAHLKAGKVDEARKAYSEALRLAPRDLDAREGLVSCAVALGDAALEAGDPDRAVSHYQMALELSPFHPEADAGLRKAAAHPKRRTGEDDPFLSALDALPPMKTLRDLQTADRVLGKVTGTAPSQAIKGSLETRRVALRSEGAPPRERRIEHEKAAAWRRRWVFRALPLTVVGAAVVLFLLTGSPDVLTWGLVLGLFAVGWDLMFVESGAAAHRRLEAEGEAR